MYESNNAGKDEEPVSSLQLLMLGLATTSLLLL